MNDNLFFNNTDTDGAFFSA